MTHGIAAAPMMPEAVAGVTPMAPKGPLVLLVDDDDLVREMAADMLHCLGCRVLQAANGMAALALLEAAPEAGAVAVLVADYAMPGMSGLELIAAASVLRPRLPALLITGHTEIEPGPVPVLHKPFTLGDLAARIAALSGPAPTA